MLPSEKITELLIQSVSGQDFLGRLHAALRQSDPHFSYQKIAKKMGFSSRAYMREVLIGKIKINQKNFYKIESGIGFNQRQARLFKWLLKVDHEVFNTENLDQRQIQEVIQKIKNTEMNRTKSKTLVKKNLDGLGVLDWPKVYASLGGGADLITVMKRSGLSKTSVQRALQDLSKENLVELKGQKYFAREEHWVLDRKTFAQVIGHNFVQTMKKAIQHAEQSIHDPDRYFFFSCISIREENFSIFKDELQKMMVKFMDRHESKDGTRPVSIALTAM